MSIMVSRQEAKPLGGSESTSSAMKTSFATPKWSSKWAARDWSLLATFLGGFLREGVTALPFFDLVLDLDGMVDIEKNISHDAANNWSESSSGKARHMDEISCSVKPIAAT